MVEPIPAPSVHPALHVKTNSTIPFLERTMVLIPALNEEDCIGHVVKFWIDLGARRVRVVDNGSLDKTDSKATEAGADVVLEPQKGYGSAALRGLMNWPSDCDWVLFSSGDGSDRLSIQEGNQWQMAIESGANMVLGDRTQSQSAIRQLQPIQRLGNWICCRAIAKGWERKFRDMASMRLVERKSFESLKLKNQGFGWNVEMQVRAIENQLNIVELPVGYYPRLAGESKISGNLIGTIRAGLGILKMLIHLWRLRSERTTRIVNEFATPIH